MSKRDRRVAVASRWAWALVLGGACVLGRSEESVRDEFKTYVDGANHCMDARECTMAYADCPLGCTVAVRADRKADVEQKARELVNAYERGGHSCVYDCAAPTGVACLVGRCALTYDSGSGGTGGGSGGGTAGTGSGASGGSGGFGGRPILPGSGGAGGLSGGGPNLPLAFLDFSPQDGTTATQGSELLLLVYDSSDAANPAALEALRSGAVLQTWPERMPVPSTAIATTYVEEKVGSSTPRPVIRVTPSEPLGDRWYALVATSLPTTFASGGVAFDDGTTGTRFRPTSHPRVRLIENCEKASGVSKLLIHFSEPVTNTTPSSNLITVSDAVKPYPCDVSESMTDQLSEICIGLSPIAHVKIEIAAGMQGATAIPLEPVTLDVDFGAQILSGGCRVFWPPIP